MEGDGGVIIGLVTKTNKFVFVELQGGRMKYGEYMFRDCFNCGLGLSYLVIATFSFAILYIITSQASLRLSSRLRQFKCCRRSSTQDIFPCQHIYFCNICTHMFR
jgi:hypothetical protein